MVDAKGVFDTLVRDPTGSKNDRRSAIDLAVCRETLGRIGGTVRRVPHPVMTVDALTKADLAKSNAAQLHMLKSGMMKLTPEKDSLSAHCEDPTTRDRSRAASLRQLSRS